MTDPDYIVVGAGASGCALAARLTDDPNVRVTLLESGPPDTDARLRVPMGFGSTITDPSLTWVYQTEPEPGSAMKPAVWLRGRTLGGSSAVNGMIYCRGQPQDYNDWARAGCTGWAWSDMEPVFKAMEDYELGPGLYRGVGGPLPVSIQTNRTPVTAALLQAAQTMQIPVREDVNEHPMQGGIGYTPVTIRKGRRFSAAHAFLTPEVRRRPNLRIITGATARRLVLSDRTVTGVEVEQQGKVSVVSCGHEVILSAGSLESPRLLQLSGIGPGAHLASVGITPVVDLPGVGGNMREHKTVTMELRLRNPAHSHNRRFRRPGLWWSIARYLVSRSGPLATTYDLNGFVRTRPDLERPDAQLTFWSLTMDNLAGQLSPERLPGIRAMGYPLRTRSAGRVAITGPDPKAPLKINPNFLADPYDAGVLLRLFRIMRQLSQHETVAPWIAEEVGPGPDVQSDEDILDSIRRGATCLHATGTCQMGIGPDAVVAPDLRVRGVAGLRVCDLSIAPTQISGNTSGRPWPSAGAAPRSSRTRARRRDPDPGATGAQPPDRPWSAIGADAHQTPRPGQTG